MWTTSVGGCSVVETVAPTVVGQSLDHRMFIQNVRSARRGAVAGPSGVTAEHLKPISARDAELLCQAAEHGQSFNSGRGVASDSHGSDDSTGDIIRRLVSRTMAQQIGNVMLRDLDLLPQAADTRRVEVVADGLPLHHGAQLAIDTTMVSPLRRDGVPATERGGVGNRQETEGETLPRAVGPVWESTSGGAGV